MPSKYFQKTGAKNPDRTFPHSCMPLEPLSDEKIDAQEEVLVEQSILAAARHDPQQERFLCWMMELFGNWDNPLCDFRETPHNYDDPYWENSERWDWDAASWQLRLGDARELLRNPDLSEEQRKFVETELAWAKHTCQGISSGVEALRFYYQYPMEFQY